MLLLHFTDFVASFEQHVFNRPRKVAADVAQCLVGFRSIKHGLRPFDLGCHAAAGALCTSTLRMCCKAAVNGSSNR